MVTGSGGCGGPCACGSTISRWLFSHGGAIEIESLKELLTICPMVAQAKLQPLQLCKMLPETSAENLARRAILASSAMSFFSRTVSSMTSLLTKFCLRIYVR